MENINELVKKMFESAEVLEKFMVTNDIKKAEDALTESLFKLINDSKKVDDLYGIMTEEKKQNLNEIMTDLFHIGIIIGVVTRDMTLIPTLQKMLKEHTGLQQKLQEFQKRNSRLEINMFG